MEDSEEPKCWEDLLALGWQKQEGVTATGRKTLSFKTPPKPGGGPGRIISRALHLREFKSFVTILFPNSLEAKDIKAENSQVFEIIIQHNIHLSVQIHCTQHAHIPYTLHIVSRVTHSLKTVQIFVSALRQTVQSDLLLQKPKPGFNTVRIPCGKLEICSHNSCGKHSLRFLKPEV